MYPVGGGGDIDAETVELDEGVMGAAVLFGSTVFGDGLRVPLHRRHRAGFDTLPVFAGPILLMAGLIEFVTQRPPCRHPAPSKRRCSPSAWRRASSAR
jgi:hypothetical protein